MILNEPILFAAALFQFRLFISTVCRSIRESMAVQYQDFLSTIL